MVALTDDARRKVYELIKADMTIPKSQVKASLSNWSDADLSSLWCCHWRHDREHRSPFSASVFGATNTSCNSLYHAFSCKRTICALIVYGWHAQSFVHVSQEWHGSANNDEYVSPEKYGEVMLDTVFSICPKVSGNLWSGRNTAVDGMRDYISTLPLPLLMEFYISV